MKIWISLLSYLEKLIEGIRGPAPEVVVKEKTPVQFKLLIALDGTKIPCPIVSAVPKDQLLFFGDILNPRVAEHKAIMSVKKYLEETFAVEIHDISHSKILACQMKLNQVVSSIEAFIRRFHSFLKEYQSCINHLDPV